jgi:hypothetical protein
MINLMGRCAFEREDDARLQIRALASLALLTELTYLRKNGLNHVTDLLSRL